MDLSFNRLPFRNISKNNFLFFALVLFSGILFSGKLFSAEPDDDKSVISIEQAQKSEYKKDPVNGGECILLSGDVRVSVSHGNSKTTITADSINYNRSTDMIYAEGNVALEQEDGSEGGEKISATSLLFNTSTLEGVFDDGRVVQTSSDALNLPSGSTLIVASDVFGRDSGGTIAFRSGALTFCDDENPHWRILASRIWLLPGGEFAFFNALLFVGRVPLLYLPAFYYPKDELLFNPAFGYKQREGYYINTTTYLYGRKPADAVSTASLHGSSDGSSDAAKNRIDLYSFMNSGTLKKQRREGLVLHNLDEDFTGNTTSHFKIMGDYYANLGAMAGFDGVFRPSDYVTELEMNGEFGFSNTIFRTISSQASKSGTPDKIFVSRSENGKQVSDHSNFLGNRLPFRYQGKLKMVVAKPFALTLSLPLYSDPYFDSDFNKRAETMDWIDYFMTSSEKSSSASSSTTDSEQAEISSFTWSLNGSRSFKLPEPINPYLSNFSVSSIGSSIVFSSKANEKLLDTTVNFQDSAIKSELEKIKASELASSGKDSEWALYSPERKFYYPSQITPLKTTLKFSGTLIQYPAKNSRKTRVRSKLKLAEPEELAVEPDEKKESNPDKKKDGSENDESSAAEPLLPSEYLPVLSVPAFAKKSINDVTYSLGYTLTPDFNSQFSYSAANLATPSDFDWNKIQSTYFQVRTPFNLTSRLGVKDEFFLLTNTLQFDGLFQKHPHLMKLDDEKKNGGYSEASMNSIRLSDYSARRFDFTETNSVSFKPFYYTEHFSETSLTWNTTIKMLRLKYRTANSYMENISGVLDATSMTALKTTLSDYYNRRAVYNPEWEYLTTDLDDEDCVTSHNMNLLLSASEFDKKLKQELSLTTTLPPQVDEYTGALKLTFPFVTFEAGTGIKKTSQTDSTWIKKDFTQSLSLDLFSQKLRLTESFVYNLEDDHRDSLKFALSGYGLQVAYLASYRLGYTFKYTKDVDGTILSREGWVEDDEKKFQPYQLSLAYVSPSVTIKRWKNRIAFAPSLSTSLVYDFTRPTSSYFKFLPAFTFKINEFLDVTFSAESKNSVIYRYFGSKRDLYYGSADYEKNVFKDLVNSFRFDSESKRKASGFKLQSLNVTVSHGLDDWDFNCTFSIKPRLVTEETKSYYDFSPYFAVSVVWRPLSSMKTEIVDEYGTWKLNP